MAKAKKIPFLNPEQPLNICVQKILAARFEEMISFEGETIDGSDIEALHDMRVASRRVQAVLKIFRGAFPKKKYKTEYAELRSLIRALGEVRDYDVFIDKTEKLKKTFQKQNSGNAGSGYIKAADNRAFDMLIAGKKTEREHKRKILIQHINNLNAKGYKEHLYRFISEFL